MPSHVVALPLLCPDENILCSHQIVLHLCFTMSKEEQQYPESENAGHSYFPLPCGQLYSPFPGGKVQSHDLVQPQSL